MAKKQQAGIVYDVIVPGAFYRGTMPGGFADVTTGIFIPGPKVNLAKDGTRAIESISLRTGDIPDPIQMPHFRMVHDPDDKKTALKEMPFDFYSDKIPKIHDGIEQALGTNIIQMVSDEDMEEFYPEAWAKRKEKIVFSVLKHNPRPMGDLMTEALQQRKILAGASANVAATVAGAVAVAAGAITSPPPGAPTFA